MSKYVLITIGSDGDVRPFLLLGQALKERGHSVTLVTHCHYEEQARSRGINFQTLDTNEQFEHFIQDGNLINDPRGFVVFFRRHILPRFQEQYTLLLQQCDKETTIITRFLSFVCAQAVSEKTGARLVSLFSAPNELTALPLLAQVFQATVSGEINSARESVGLTKISDWNGWLNSPGLSLGMWPSWFAPEFKNESNNTQQVIPAGFSIDKKNGTAGLQSQAINELPGDIKELIDRGEKPVLITGGTGLFVDSNYFTACARACSASGRPGLLVAKHKQNVPENLPEGIKWYSYLPFSSVLPHLGAIIHHGGIGTVSQSLAAGIPQLILPIGADRPDNAARIKKLGLGDTLSPDKWKETHIQTALEGLLDNPAGAERCLEYSAALQNEEDFTGRACRELEHFSANPENTAHIQTEGKNGKSDVVSSKSEANDPQRELSPEKRALLAALLRKKKNNSGDKEKKNAQGKDLSPERQAYLAHLLRKKKAKAKKSRDELFSLNMDRANRHEPFPLTDVQQAYWLGRRTTFELGGVATHGYMEFDCKDIDLLRLNRAWQLLIERHEMLHAVILPTGMQQIMKEVPEYVIQVVDLEGKDEKTIERELERIKDKLSHQVLPVEQWPPFEIIASRFDESTIKLHVSFDVLFTDGWSVWIVINELHQLYHNPDVKLPELELSFRDYVKAEKEFQESGIYKKSLEYWQKRVETFPGAPELPVISKSDSLTQPRFVRRTTQIEEKYWQNVKKTAEKEGLTPTIVVLTAFSEVLARWSKNPRFTINLTLFNRMPFHTQAKQIIGDFTSLTLLEADHTKQLSFTERAKQMRDQLWQDLDHRYVSGVRVLREIAKKQSGTRAALMPVVFTSTMNLPANPGGSLFEWLGEYKYGISQTPQVWLDNQVTEDEGTLVFNWDAVEDIFPAGLLDDMFEAFKNMLISLGDGKTDWNSLSALSAPEDQLALQKEVNNTAGPVSDKMLHTLFEEKAASGPDNIAVVSAAKTLTYSELASYSRKIGRFLRSKGALPGQLVAIVMHKGWEQAAAALGILQSGAAYLPVDASLPAERIAYLFEQTGAKIALTQSDLMDSVRWPEGILAVPVDTDKEITSFSDEVLAPVQKETDLAYVIYTSGSTGLPKGVMIDHRGAVNTILDVNERFSVSEKDSVLALSALNFDLSVYDLFGLLAGGGKIVMPEPGTNRNPEAWIKYIEENRITMWNTVPTLMEMLIEYSENLPQADLSSLKSILMSGDWIPVTLPDRIRKFSPGADIYSLGGATEASIWSIWYPIQAVDQNWPSIPYGKAMRNQTFFVLDHNLEPSPVWVPGELYIGGIGVALGYFNDEARTKSSFITHPQSGERLYKTGDLGRFLPDGNIEFLGREDFQVKIRGHRIELGEIETALLQHDNIRSAVVTVISEKDKKGSSSRNQTLAAYIVLENQLLESGLQENNGKDITGQLKEFLAQKVPSYMVPGIFMVLNELPLSANGKVAREALPKPKAKKKKKVQRGPSSQLEHEIANLWKENLKLDVLSADDNFFELGGDSILIIQMHSQLQNLLEREIPVNKLFEYPTVNSLADFLKEDGEGKDKTLEKVEQSAQNRKSRMQQRQRRRTVRNN